MVFEKGKKSSTLKGLNRLETPSIPRISCGVIHIKSLRDLPEL